MDDMLVKSKEVESHLDDLKETFETLRRYKMSLNLAKCAFGVFLGKFLDFMVSQRGIEANPKKVKAILEMSVDTRFCTHDLIKENDLNDHSCTPKIMIALHTSICSCITCISLSLHYMH